MLSHLPCLALLGPLIETCYIAKMAVFAIAAVKASLNVEAFKKV